MSNIENFGSRLKALGGRLDYPDTFKNKYVDIEEFLLDATIYVSKDSRLLASVENWIYAFGFIVSPSKIKTLITKNEHQYDPSVLSAFCEIIKGSKLKKINLSCLDEYLRPSKHAREVLISKAIPTRSKFRDPLWFKFKLMKSNYKENNSKYLLPFKTILKNSPEIRNRIQGLGHVNADYLSVISKEGKQKSIRALSLKINAAYPTVHQIDSRLNAFGLVS